MHVAILDAVVAAAAAAAGSRIAAVLQYNSKMHPNLAQFMYEIKLDKDIVAVSEVSTSATAATVAAAAATAAEASLNSATPAATTLEKSENIHAIICFVKMYSIGITIFNCSCICCCRGICCCY